MESSKPQRISLVYFGIVAVCLTVSLSSISLCVYQEVRLSQQQLKISEQDVRQKEQDEKQKDQELRIRAQQDKITEQGQRILQLEQDEKVCTYINYIDH